MRFAAAALLLLACRRESPVVRKDLAADASPPRVAADLFLVHGRVVDLGTFRVVHQLSKALLEERATGDRAWIINFKGRVEVYELATGKLRFTSTGLCAQLVMWGDRAVCKNGKGIAILSPDGIEDLVAIESPVTDVVPMGSSVLVRRLSGELDAYDEHGRHVGGHPKVPGAAIITAQGDGYCLSSSDEIECRRADGTRRMRTAVTLPLADKKVKSVTTFTDAHYQITSAYSGVDSATVVYRLADGQVAMRATPAAEVMVIAGGGTLSGLLRGGAALDFVDVDGKTRWTTTAPGLNAASKAIAHGDMIVAAGRAPSFAAGLRAANGMTVWSRKFDDNFDAQGIFYPRQSLSLRGQLLIVHDESVSLGSANSARMHFLDAVTGDLRFTDAM